MRRALLLGLAFMLPLPASAQSINDLKRQLREREAEVRALQQRIEVLERERAVPPAAAAPAPSAAPSSPAEADLDINRALERALVRQGTILLSQGTYEIEPNFVYTHFSAMDFRRDSYGPGLSFRAGLPWNSQFDISLPFVIEHRHTALGSRSNAGIGDLSFGLSHQITTELPWVPSVVGSISYSPATGRNTVFSERVGVALGGGFDTITGSLNASKRLDPLVFFGSYAYSYPFDDTKGSLRVEPGDVHDVRIGTILAASPDTSLRVSFDLAFVGATKINTIKLPQSDEPSGIFEVGGSVVLTEALLLDVSVGAGVTRAAPDFRISVGLPFRF